MWHCRKTLVKMNMKFKVILPVFFGISQIALSQIKEERLVLDRKREPEVKRIEKKKTSVDAIRSYPPQSKKVEDSLNLKYQITDVPAVSDFKTSTIPGSDISPRFNTSFQRNYVRLGAGNYGKLLGDANISALLDDNMEIGADVHYLSTSGLKNDYAWKSDQRGMEVSAFVNGYQKSGKYNVTANYKNDSYNYYGIYAMDAASDADIRQTVNKSGINGYYDFYDSPILEEVAGRVGFLSDHFGTKENSYRVQAKLKHEWELPKVKDAKISLEGDTEFKGLNTDFGILDQNTANHFIIEFSPMIRFKKGESFLAVGANMNWLSQHNEVLQEESSSSDFSIIPQIEAQYFIRPELIIFGSLNGGVELNSYADLLKKNPYLASNQVLKPTDTKYKVSLGAMGDITPNLKYNVSGAYSELDDVAMFRQNGSFTDLHIANRAPYDYLNTFSTDYFTGKLAEIKGELVYMPMDNLSLDAEFAYNKYSLEDGQKMYNTPVLKSTISAKYSVLNNKLLLGFMGIFASGTTTNSFLINGSTATLQERTDTSVDGFADVNLTAEYKFHKNFSIFAIGNNLLNQKYQSFYGYKVLGAQVLAGVKFSF